MDQRVLVVIPAHNEEHTIAAVLTGLRRDAPAFDRIVVDDCSNDGTVRVIEHMGEKHLHLIQNLGYGQALQTGMKYGLARGYDIIVSMDADGQHLTTDASRLVAALQETGADLVIGSRFCAENGYETPIDRRLGQLLFSHLTLWLLRQRIYDTSSGFKAMRADACREIVSGSFLDFHMESIVQLHLSKYKIVEIPIKVQERTHGQSMYSLASIFQYPLKTMLLTIVAMMDAFLLRRAR